MGTIVEDLCYPGVELRETHISWVFLSDREVFKIKKPVDLGFVDFTSIDKRRAACEDEVRLNRRLTTDVYYGVVPVCRDEAGMHRIDGQGDGENLVDWAVHMRRLPDSDRADLLLAENRLSHEQIEAVATRVAHFHDAYSDTEEPARHGAATAVLRNVEENFTQTRDTIHHYLSREQTAEVEGWQRRFIEDNGALFAERIRRGRVRDGHGDLRLEHVYIGDNNELAIIDCIEFNDRFRYADVCSDVVFLAMDLAWHGRVDLAEYYLARYALESDDYDLYALVDFYESYRAFVRGKIASFVAASSGFPHDVRAKAASEARRYFLLALASERRSLLAPSIVAVGGVLASGKSTIARLAGAAMGAPVISADRTRKRISGVSPLTPMRQAPWSGIYSPDVTRRVYSELVRRCEVVLASGRPVVLDASFRSKAFRRAVRKFALDHQVPFIFVECRADKELCRSRLRKREFVTGVSDGRLAIFDAFVRRWDSVIEFSPEEHLVLDTSQPLGTSEAVLRHTLPVWPEGLVG